MVNPKSALIKPSQMQQNAFWLSFIPVLGGLAIIYEGNRLNATRFIQLGLGVLALSLVSALAGSITFAWLVQIALAIFFRLSFVAPPPPLQKVDFNNCSKDELVRVLNLPIVYANDIELCRNEGYLFTHAEELTEIAGIPVDQVQRISPHLMFAYDAMKDTGSSWRRVNYLSSDEIAALGVTYEAAQKIVDERADRGGYRSAVDIKRRTGLALRDYKLLM